MTGLVWDKVGARVYETGLDKGVLYLPNGFAVPWNGLTSVIEKFDKDTTPIYYDGMKVNELVVLGDFNATMKAVTYPDEFVEIEGLAAPRRGAYFADQMPQTFGLCYRTQIGNDLQGDSVGYKIHIIYNVIAIPNDKTYASVTDDPSLVEFEWNISAVPEEFPGFRPTAHIVLDSTKLDPWLLEEIEVMLYGKVGANASLIPMPDLVKYITEWFRVKIIDNGDGTWTAISKRDGYIFIDGDLFTIVRINARYIDDDTYIISDTLDITDVPQIKIVDNGDGTWTATTDQDGLIVFIDDGEFQIRNATTNPIDSTRFEIMDTLDNG